MKNLTNFVKKNQIKCCILAADNLYLSNRRVCSVPDGNSNRQVVGTPNHKNERQEVKQEGKPHLNSCL